VISAAYFSDGVPILWLVRCVLIKAGGLGCRLCESSDYFPDKAMVIWLIELGEVICQLKKPKKCTLGSKSGNSNAA
jgi:hypothetical protein